MTTWYTLMTWLNVRTICLQFPQLLWFLTGRFQIPSPCQSQALHTKQRSVHRAFHPCRLLVLHGVRELHSSTVPPPPKAITTSLLVVVLVWRGRWQTILLWIQNPRSVAIQMLIQNPRSVVIQMKDRVQIQRQMAERIWGRKRTHRPKKMGLNCVKVLPNIL